ncbi:hypothetical protein CDAR_412971 [Caerostris darwini]|uniref:Uncharacterized protein n=1 Tax=Caerostris darwini TaxID=1538125 RepID=A0AAV4PNQ8_9ARAC|nr:hypothetical protein CDAR_412971 [Caerostris darwini]
MGSEMKKRELSGNRIGPGVRVPYTWLQGPGVHRPGYTGIVYRDIDLGTRVRCRFNVFSKVLCSYVQPRGLGGKCDANQKDDFISPELRVPGGNGVVGVTCLLARDTSFRRKISLFFRYGKMPPFSSGSVP